MLITNHGAKMYNMSDNEFYSLERDDKGNISELIYWNTIFTPEQKKSLTEHDIKAIEEIKYQPGYLGIQLALDY